MTKKTWVRFVLPVVMLGLPAWQPSMSPAVTALALVDSTTISASVGPIALPDVPVSVCINDDCVNTPTLSNVSATVSVTAVTEVGKPTITTSSCPSGSVGAVFTITTGGTSATVTVVVSGSRPDGTPFSQTIGPVTVPGLSTATVTVCAAVS